MQEGGGAISSTGGRMAARYNDDLGGEQGFSESIKGLFYPGRQRAVDAFANSFLTEAEQRAIHSYVMRGVRQALDPRSPYDLQDLFAEDISKANIQAMPYPLQRAYWFMVTRNSVDALNIMATLQAHVGYLLQPPDGRKGGGGNSQARYGKRMQRLQGEVAPSPDMEF